MQHGNSSKFRELAELLDGLFAKSLAQSISSLTGEDAEAKAGPQFSGDDSSIWFEWGLIPETHGKFWFGGSKQPWVDLANKILFSGDGSEPDVELIDSTLTEIASQVAGSITTFLNHQYQKQMETGSVQIEEGSRRLDPEIHNSFHQVRLADGATISVHFTATSAVFESLIPVKQQAEKQPELAVDASKLGLLLDVEMPVSISIGRTQMSLKDVVKLTTGSVVELSRNVSEPVDIVVNNCVVARGDVVVVEGNFGVRIREVLSKEDRIRQLAAS